MKFSYTAIEVANGRTCSGVVEGATTEQAATLLKARGLAPTALVVSTEMAEGAVARRRPSAPKERGVNRNVRPALQNFMRARLGIFGRAGMRGRVTLFTRQLATLVKAGMPLLRAVEVLQRQESAGLFAQALARIAETIRGGGTLTDGLRLYPKIFDRLYVNMVKAGEAGGALEVVLDRVARFREKSEKTKAKVRAAMTYPAVVVLLASGIVAALMVFVVPKFEQIFAGMLKGQPLPALTRGVLGVSRFAQDNLLATVAIVAVVGFGVSFVARTALGRRAVDRIALRMPIMGDLCVKAAASRFARTFGTSLTSGVPILQALLITRDTSGNVHVANAVQRVHDRVKEGGDVARPLAATAVFPPMVTSMIEVGEETGSLPEMLGRIADTYDEEVDTEIASLTSLVEPLMIVFLALLVGTIVIALFLPIVSIIQHLQ
jgi:type IV pilus assembly protein PilC